MGDDLDQQGVVVGGDDSSLEGRSIIQADAHALSAPEHLWGKRGVRKGSEAKVKMQPQPQLDKMGSQLWLAKFCFISVGAFGGKQGREHWLREADPGTQTGDHREGDRGLGCLE